MCMARVRFRFLPIFTLLAALLVLAAGACARGGPASEFISEEEFQVALAKHLNAVGSTVYEIEDCSWCEEQLEWFGEGSTYINQVYCIGSEQLNPQPMLCKAKGIEGIPTWEINGQMYRGARPLMELARLSGYEGPFPEGLSGS